jgi:hypothetical protein
MVSISSAGHWHGRVKTPAFAFRHPSFHYCTRLKNTRLYQLSLVLASLVFSFRDMADQVPGTIYIYIYIYLYIFLMCRNAGLLMGKVGPVVNM